MTETMNPPLTRVAARAVEARKEYGMGEAEVRALDDISVTLPAGSMTTIMGPSGSGKSTFLHVAAGLDRPDQGAVTFGDTELTRLSERRLTILRRERIGFVFQAFNLMPSLTVEQAMERVVEHLVNRARSTRSRLRKQQDDAPSP